LKGVIVYYGDRGHCRQLAEMVIKGLLEHEHEVALLEARTQPPDGMEFLVVGAPTELGRLPGHVRHFIDKRVGDEWKGKPFGAFSTGDKKLVDKGERQAADLIYQALLDKGLIPAAAAFKAGVVFMKGPLSPGMMGAAYRFGLELGEALKGGTDDVIVR
jgi:menaquinone-dependent protoporphyrinogen IX oxidase